METADGQASALALSISSSGVAKDTVMNGSAKTFEVGSTRAQQGLAGGKMSAEERKAIGEAIEKSTSLDEIKKLEDRLRLGYSIATMSQD